jgi:putative transposase
VTGAALEELVALVRTRRACALVGVPRASLYRRRRPAVAPTSRPRPAPPNALTPAERQQLLEVLHQRRFCDLPAAQVWARLLDEGTSLAWISTMYRLLGAHGERRDRRRQRTTPPASSRSCWPASRTTGGPGISPSSPTQPGTSSTTWT